MTQNARPARNQTGLHSPEAGSATPEVSSLLKQISDLDESLSKLRRDVAELRSRPTRALFELLNYRLLNFLAMRSPPLPRSMAARFSRSAEKRNPLRSLPENELDRLDQLNGFKHRAARPSATAGSVVFDPTRRTVLVVSHEASRTGAPILALNIAQQLSQKYNVACLVLGDGPLLDAFKKTSVQLYHLPRAMHRKWLVTAIRILCSDYTLSYALVNSIESRRVLAGLKDAGVPTVALLHEFAAYTRPATAFLEVFEAADEVIFSTRITLENALDQYGLLRGASIHVLPQGKCIVPLDETSEAKRELEREWLDSVLRPSGRDDEFLVLGAGTVEPRKGVNLFIECATRLITRSGGGRYRFVWIGNGYNPDGDTALSAYLSDQIARSGVGTQFSIVRSTSEIEHAYRTADVFLLSSMLDPLPNVAVDALVAGTPVLCFERTGGIADFLLDAGLGDTCVAPYLDTSDMAEKLAALASDSDLRATVASRGQNAAKQQFDLTSYIEKIDAIGNAAAGSDLKMAEDKSVIAASGRFRSDFFLPPDAAERGDPINQYLRSSRSGRNLRKPMAGFNPLIFASRFGVQLNSDPFAAYLREGEPAGPWSRPVIDGSSAIDSAASASLRVALHLHIVDPDQLVGLLARLSMNEIRPDLFVNTSLTNAAYITEILVAGGWQFVLIESKRHIQSGWGGFLIDFSKVWAGYDVVGHITVARAKRDEGVAFATETMIGADIGGAMLDRILTAFASTAAPAIVYPDDPRISGWGRARPSADRLARRLCIARLPDQIDYPTIGACWMKVDKFDWVFELALQWDDFPAGVTDDDCAVLEAIPMLLAVVPELRGHYNAVVNLHGLSR